MTSGRPYGLYDTFLDRPHQKFGHHIQSVNLNIVPPKPHHTGGFLRLRIGYLR